MSTINDLTKMYRTIKNAGIVGMLNLDGKNKGEYGEYLISQYLRHIPGEKVFLSNLYLPKDDQTTTEIDILMIHETGIYVFESKNYSGWIFGSEHQSMWTQSLVGKNGKSEKHHFYNPILQNTNHIRWLKQFLINYPQLVYHSFIVFSDRCELKKIELSTNNHIVVNRYNLPPIVANIIKSSRAILAPQSVLELSEALRSLTLVTTEVKQSHINEIQGFQNQTITLNKQKIRVDTVIRRAEEANQSFAESKYCIKCGSPMILKTASKGNYRGKKFLGCSAYPNCRFVVYEDGSTSE